MDMDRKKYFLIVVLLGLFSPGIWSQTKVVKGLVTAFDKYPVKNMKVVAQKAGSIVNTDSLGHFTIVCTKNDKLLFEVPGFKTRRKSVKGKDFIKVTLSLNENERDVLLKDGYGYIDARDLTTSLSNYNVAKDPSATYRDIYSLIQSRFSSVQVRNGKFYIRGGDMRSVNSDTPALLVVDGVIVNDISSINPNDVATVDLLKDSSAAIYGARGAGGVIVISLKRGNKY